MRPAALHRSVVGLWLALAALSASAQTPEPMPANLVAPTDPRTPEEERAGFHLPPGFEIELVASEPQINKPMNLAFDDRGRLWVTSTVEYPFPAQDGQPGRDRVLILDHFGPDGRAGRVRTFADGLNIPIGLLPLGRGDEAFVHAIPNIYRMADTDGDGKADRREVAYGVFGHRDTHGMTNAFSPGFDGWIYATHGFSNTSEVKGADGRPIVMQSGNTYRMRPDGSHAELFTRGQVNPFGLAWDPLGNLYAADCHSRPVYQLLRGGFYPSFGKPDDGLGFAPEMVTHDHGSTGIAGVVYYAADHFPAPWRDSIFIGNVVTSRINHDTIAWRGSTPVGQLQPDFLVSDDPWFRPVDLKLGPDGALYVADFYNKIIGHYEVPLTHPGRDRERGRIWRIVYKGPDGRGRPAMPRVDWSSATVIELADDLGHPNLAVRLRAADQLAGRSGDEATRAAQAAAEDRSRPTRRAHALWVLQRRAHLDESSILEAFTSPEPLVRVHVQRILGERAELTPALRDLALSGLADPDAHVRRASAEALGRHPDPAQIRPLIALRDAVPADDTHLLHVVRMALRDQLLRPEAWASLPPEPEEREAFALADVAPGIPLAEAARFLLGARQRSGRRPGSWIRDVRHIARYGDDSTVAALVDAARTDRPDDLGHQAALLKAVAQGTQERGRGLEGDARAWALDLARRLIALGEDSLALRGYELAGGLKLAEVGPSLAEVASDRSMNELNRGGAIEALVALDPAGAVGPLGRILGDFSEPALLRMQVAGALARNNRPESGDALVSALPTAPARLQSDIAAGLARGGRSGAERLLAAVESGRASARLLRERPVELLLANAGVPDLDARLARLTAGLPDNEGDLQALLASRRAGFALASASNAADPARGAAIFEKTCAACHQLGGNGARIGPQLDGVGIRGAERLVEDILDPNRNVDQEFRTTTLALTDGRIVSGLLLNEAGEVLVLADSAGQEVRVGKEEVEERRISILSPMPANFADAIPEAEFPHLLAYLLAQRPQTPPGTDLPR